MKIKQFVTAKVYSCQDMMTALSVTPTTDNLEDGMNELLQGIPIDRFVGIDTEGNEFTGAPFNIYTSAIDNDDLPITPGEGDYLRNQVKVIYGGQYQQQAAISDLNDFASDKDPETTILKTFTDQQFGSVCAICLYLVNFEP